MKPACQQWEGRGDDLCIDGVRKPGKEQGGVREHGLCHLSPEMALSLAS